MFVAQSAPISKLTPSSFQKRQKFRLQIRKQHFQKKRHAMRNELVQSLRSLRFLEFLKSERDNLTAKRIHQLLDGLEMGLSNAVFYHKINQMGLQHYLCQMLRSNELDYYQKSKILKSLAQLTYYCFDSPKVIIDNNIIDYMIPVLRGLNMQSKQEQDFLFYALTLTLNLTSDYNKELNYHIMYSDLPMISHQHIERLSRIQLEQTSQMRETLLKIYGNLFNLNLFDEKFALKTLDLIIKDSNNYIASEQLLKCLIRLSKVDQHFWLTFLKNKDSCQFFNYLSGILIKIECDFSKQKIHYEEIELFQLYMQLIISFCVNHQITSLGIDLFNLITQYILPKSIGKIYYSTKDEEIDNHTKIKIALLKTIKAIYLNLQTNPEMLGQNKITTSKMQMNMFIAILLDEKLIKHPKYSQYLFGVLNFYLKLSKQTLDVMIENGLFDRIQDVLQDFEYLNNSKIQILELLKHVIQAQQILQPSNKNYVIGTLYAKGIIGKIQRLQDSEIKDVFKKAQEFMHWLSNYQKQEDFK